MRFQQSLSFKLHNLCEPEHTCLVIFGFVDSRVWLPTKVLWSIIIYYRYKIVSGPCICTAGQRTQQASDHAASNSRDFTLRRGNSFLQLFLLIFLSGFHDWVKQRICYASSYLPSSSKSLPFHPFYYHTKPYALRATMPSFESKVNSTKLCLSRLNWQERGNCFYIIFEKTLFFSCAWKSILVRSMHRCRLLECIQLLNLWLSICL